MTGIEIALVGIAIALGWQIAAGLPRPKRVKIRLNDQPAPKGSRKGASQ